MSNSKGAGKRKRVLTNELELKEYFETLGKGARITYNSQNNAYMYSIKGIYIDLEFTEAQISFNPLTVCFKNGKQWFTLHNVLQVSIEKDYVTKWDYIRISVGRTISSSTKCLFIVRDKGVKSI